MKLKKIMAMVLCVAMVLSTMSFNVFAATNYLTAADVFPVADADGVITLVENITLPEDTRFSEELKINLNGKTLNVTTSVTFNGSATLYNGKINADGVSCPDGIIRADYHHDGEPAVTLKLENVTVNANNVEYGTGLFYVEDENDTLVLTDVDVVTSGADEDPGSGVFYSASSFSRAKVILNEGTTVTSDYSKAIFFATDVELDGAAITCSNVSRPVFRQTAGTVKDSTITVNSIGAGQALVADEAGNNFGVVNFVNSTVTAPEGTPAVNFSNDGSAVKADSTSSVGNNEGVLKDDDTPAEKIVATVDGKKFTNLQKAIESANDGDVITVLADINLADTELQLLDGSYDTYFLVEGKNITIDLNGKTISGAYTGTNTMLVGVFSTDNNGHLTIIGNGTVDVTATSKVYSLIANYEDGCSITIKNGTYKLDKASDSLIYSGGKTDAAVKVEGGTFTLGNVGEGENGKPWIVNVLGAGDHHVFITGGTFNADVNRQHWSNEAVVDETCYTVDNGDGTYTVKDGAVAYVNTGMTTGPYFAPKNIGYATLTEAIAAAVAANDSSVVLIKDTVTTEEFAINTNSSIVLDLNGHTLNGAIKPSNGDITVKNGSIVNTDSNYSGIEINAGSLTLENVNIDSARHGVRIDGAVEAVINGGEYKLSATSGTRHAVNVSGAANVTIKAGTFIGPKGTTMDSGSAVCVQDGATVTIEGGNFSGGKNATLGVSGTMSVYGGTFDQDPSKYVAVDYVSKANDDGTYSVIPSASEVAVWSSTVSILPKMSRISILGQTERLARIRLFAGIDDTSKYDSYGFKYSATRNGEVVSGTITLEEVFTSVEFWGGTQKYIYTGEIFGANNKYVMDTSLAVPLDWTAEDISFTITPFVVYKGTEILGTSVTYTGAQLFK